MKRIGLIMMIVVALTLTWLVYARSQTSRSTAQPPQAERQTAQQQQLAVQRTISTQQRLNRYFHSDVIPKLKNCWSRVQGRGTIEIEHTYTKEASGKWVSEKLAVTKSTLPRGQDAVALQCMQDSVRATSFSSQASDGNEQRYVVRWTWPVPFPANAAALTSAMFAARANDSGGGGGGCDGRGAPAACSNCSSDGRSCLSVCVGFKECTVTTVLCESRIACASGGPFGAGGGTIMYRR